MTDVEQPREIDRGCCKGGGGATGVKPRVVKKASLFCFRMLYFPSLFYPACLNMYLSRNENKANVKGTQEREFFWLRF